MEVEWYLYITNYITSSLMDGSAWHLHITNYITSSLMDGSGMVLIHY